MESEKSFYKFLFNNEEKRTTKIKELEQFLSENIQNIESHFRITGEIEKSNSKYNEYTEKTLKILQEYNNELRRKSEEGSENFKKDVNILLNMEKENYKYTLNIFINKLQCFDFIKTDDDYKLLQKEKEISTLKVTLASIREQINDFITNLKYKYLY